MTGSPQNSDQALPHVFRPLQIGPVEIRNRIFVSAHTTNFAERHRVSDRHVDYHRRRAAGGVGLIVTEGLRVHPTSLKRPETLSVWTDECIDGLARLAEAVRDEGARLFGQLLHSGREAADEYPRTPSWGPSPLAWARGAHIPHAMDTDEVAELIQCFVEGARRVVAAGLDGIEVHLGHGHLLQQFLSPVTNHRGDRYGGSGEHRGRVVEEILQRVRAVVPAGMAFGIRISADEFVEGGLDVAAMTGLVRGWLRRHSLDFVDVSHSAYVGGPSLATQIADMAYGSAPFRHLSRAVREASGGTPVLAACRIDGLEVAEEVLAAGDADAVAMTRAHIADPDLVAHHRAGIPPRRCTSCNQLCIGRSSLGLPMSCVVNPEVGLEGVWAETYRRYDLLLGSLALRPRVLVIGGGPAGLEAASTAARWAEVILIEKRERLGGGLASAADLEGRSNWGRLIADQTEACHRAGVHVRLGESRALDQTSEPEWDAVVAATGAVAQPRDLTGLGPMTLVTESVATPAATPDICVVFDDVGGWLAWGFVEHLLRAGGTVHYVTPLSTLAPGITMYSRLGLLDRVRASGRLRVHLMTELVAKVNGDIVVHSDLGAGETRLRGVDQVYDVGLPRAGGGKFTAGRRTVVGDAYAPRDAGWAVFSGRVGALRALSDVVAGSDEPLRRDLHRRLDALPLIGVDVDPAAGRTEPKKLVM